MLNQHVKKISIILLFPPVALIYILLLISCSVPVPVTYSPSSALKGQGTFKAETFIYLPHEQGRVEANQIKNTAAGKIYINDNLDIFITEAIAKELSFIGYTMDEFSDLVIAGVIEEFIADDFGFTIDWSISIKYDVIVRGETVYSNLFRSKTKTSKGPGFVPPAITYIIRETIESFIKDAKAKNIL